MLLSPLAVLLAGLGLSRVLEKAHNTIVQQARAAGPVRYRLFRWALSIGRRVSRHMQRKERVPLRLRLRHVLADRLVFEEIRASFGVTRPSEW